MSTLIMSSITGTRNVSPDSTVARYVPSRSTSAFSYWLTTRAARASAMRTTKRKTPRRKVRRGMPASIGSPHLESDTVHRFDGDDRSRFDGTADAGGRRREPLFALHLHAPWLVLGDTRDHDARLAQNGVDVARRGLDVDLAAHVAAAEQEVEEAEPSADDQAEVRAVQDQPQGAAEHEGRPHQHEIEA